MLRRILAARPEMSIETLTELVEAKKRELGSLLTDTGAAYLVSQDLEVELFEETTPRLESPIRSLMPGLKDVSVSGRILVLHSPRSFVREDGSQGRALRLVLGDATGFTGVILWDSKVDDFLGESLAEGGGVRLVHCYTREDPEGGVEVHVGERAAIQPLEEAYTRNVFPKREELLVKIGELRQVGGSVWVEATVAQTPPPSVFQREDGQGQVRRLLLQDETGQIPLVLWNEEIENVSQVKEGSRIQVLRGILRPGLGGKPEIHLGRWGKATVQLRGGSADRTKARIADLGQAGGSRWVEAAVVAVAPLREFTSSGGKPGRVLSLLLGDETGMVRLTLWDEAVEDGLGLKHGEAVQFQAVNVRRRLGDLEVHIRVKGALSKHELRLGESPLWVERPVPIGSLKGGQGYVTVEGEVRTVSSLRRVKTARGRETAVLTLSLEDDSGTAEASLWGALAEKAVGLTAGTHVKLQHVRVTSKRDGKPELSTSVFSTIEALDVRRP
ncbi:MAG: hypothetical protein QW057_08590 [Candidatus Bathyarchaeia archaeon]